MKADENPLNPILAEIFASRRVLTRDGKSRPLLGGIELSEGQFLQQLIFSIKPAHAIEIGCALGISSLFICDALKRCNPTAHHTIIDPGENTEYGGAGINSLKRAGFDNFTLLEERSELALPELVRRKRVFDFALIDGYHTFDATLIDFFYLNQLCREGSIIVFDDVQMRAVNRCVRYVLNFPSYRLLGHIDPPSRALWKRLLLGTGEAVAGLSAVAGEKVREAIFDQRFLKSDRQLGINGSMVAFQKVGADQRSWDWFKSF